MNWPTIAEKNLPKSFQVLRGYTFSRFLKDLVAGVTVGLVALPLALAFAIASGVPPQSGIYCAILAGFVISALGGSTVQIGGPTGAFVVVVSGIVQKHGMDGLFMVTLMAGTLLVVMGLTGLGSAIKYIPRPVVVGFTNGIAVLIASTQIKEFLGLKVDEMPGEFIGRLQTVYEAFPTLTPQVAALSTVSLVLLVLLRKFAPSVPGSIVVLVGGTVAVAVLQLPASTVHTEFGGIPSGLPTLHTPQWRPEMFATLLSPVLTVTMLGAIESLLSAVVGDRMTGDKHNPNTELAAQGVANILSPLVGGLPATGAIARTATNIRSGAQTPVAGMVHAITLLVIVLFAAPLAGHIPLAVLSAILFVVAYNMGEWEQIPDIFKLTRADIAVWAITFALTVFADLTVAVEAGMILAALLYIQRVTLTTTVTKIDEEDIDSGKDHSLQYNEIPEGAVAYRIHGPFLFGSTDKLQVILDEMETLPKIVLIRLRNMTAIDGTGVHALENLAEALRRSGRTMIVCGMRNQPARLLSKSEFHEHIGEENIQPTLRLAVERAKALLSAEPAQSPD